MNLESKGKSKGQHPHNKLDAKWIKKNHIDAGFYADGEGLYLKVDASGARRWVQRLMINSKRVDMGLGSAYLVSLADARVIARNNRAIARSGGDPLEAKRHRKEIPTFKEASYAVHALNLPTWSSDKHAKQWMQALENYVFDHFGSKRIDKITNADLMNVLALIWTEKPQTAKRIKQRIGLVLKWSIAKGFRVDNPASTIQIGLPSHKNVEVIPRKSLPYDKVSEAIQTIKNSDTLEVTKLAFEFLILTATRSGDTRGAKWSEFEGDLWSIPSKRMKMKKAHRVPLSPRCVEILELAKTYKDDSGLVFSDNGKPLLDSALSKVTNQNGIQADPHGFRASFRTWASEKTNAPHQVCEFALAHGITDKAEEAYNRSDLLEKRRNLMDAWAQYITKESADIIPIKRAKDD